MRVVNRRVGVVFRFLRSPFPAFPTKWFAPLGAASPFVLPGFFPGHQLLFEQPPRGAGRP
jgi:hypothetical protein